MWLKMMVSFPGPGHYFCSLFELNIPYKKDAGTRIANLQLTILKMNPKRLNITVYRLRTDRITY